MVEGWSGAASFAYSANHMTGRPHTPAPHPRRTLWRGARAIEAYQEAHLPFGLCTTNAGFGHFDVCRTLTAYDVGIWTWRESLLRLYCTAERFMIDPWPHRDMQDDLIWTTGRRPSRKSRLCKSDLFRVKGCSRSHTDA